MMFLTHVLFGILLGILAADYVSLPLGLFIAATAVAAVLPDIDTTKSKLGKKAEPFSTVLSWLFKHRGFLHTIAAAVIVAGAVYLIDSRYAAAAVIGYGSHLVLDAATVEGIKPLLPFSRWKVRGIITTKGFAEQVVAIAVVAAIVWML